jgi:hypothetical protein
MMPAGSDFQIGFESSWKFAVLCVLYAGMVWKTETENGGPYGQKVEAARVDQRGYSPPEESGASKDASLEDRPFAEANRRGDPATGFLDGGIARDPRLTSLFCYRVSLSFVIFSLTLFASTIPKRIGYVG